MTHTQTQGADGAGTKTAGQVAFQAFRDLNGKGLAALWCTVPGHERVGWDRAAAVTLSTACEPWSFGIGEPPEYGTPLHGVFVAGMLYTERLLANLLGVTDYEGGDGSEDFDADATMSLCNILAGAGLYDKDEGRVNAPAPAATPGVADSLREAVEKLYDFACTHPSAEGDKAREIDAAVNHVRALIAAQPAGQSADFPATDLRHMLECEKAHAKQWMDRCHEAERKLADLAPSSTRTGAAETGDKLVRLLAAVSDRLRDNPPNGLVEGDLYVAAKNEGPDSGWRYVPTGLTVGDLDEARALIAARPEAPSDAGWSREDLEAFVAREWPEGRSAGAAARELVRALGARGLAPTLQRLLTDLLGQINFASTDRAQILADFANAAPEAARMAKIDSFERWNPRVFDPTPPSDPAPSGQAEG